MKQYGKKDEPVKMTWADKTHYGIELSYEDVRLEPFGLWLRLAAYRSVLENAESFPQEVKDFLRCNTKTCDKCNYCIQTDKTGTRPRVAVTVDGESKCPLYPAFSFVWRTVTPELVDNILAALDTAYSD